MSNAQQSTDGARIEPESTEATASPRQTVDVPLERLVPHPLNANEMAPDRQAKLRNNIRRTGNYPPVIVRAHPQHEGCYEILDGHHRVEVLRDLGCATACCQVWDVDDREAKILLATLNRLQGEDVPIRRAELLDSLLHDIRVDDLALIIPEDLPDISSTLELLSFPIDDLEQRLRAEEEAAERDKPHSLTVVVTAEQKELVEATLRAAAEGLDGKPVRGLCLARICREWAEEAGQRPVVADGEAEEAAEAGEAADVPKDAESMTPE